MLLIELTLQAQTPIPLTPQEQGFPGGVLHGWFETIISHTNPDLWQALRGIKNQSARYALRVPALQAFNQVPNIHLGLMLFEPVQHHWPAILQAFNCAHTFHLGHTRTPVHIIDQLDLYRKSSGLITHAMLLFSKARGEILPKWCIHEILVHRAQHLICTAARNDAVFFAYLVAIPRHLFRCKKAFSTKCRNL